MKGANKELREGGARPWREQVSHSQGGNRSESFSHIQLLTWGVKNHMSHFKYAGRFLESFFPTTHARCLNIHPN